MRLTFVWFIHFTVDIAAHMVLQLHLISLPTVVLALPRGPRLIIPKTRNYVYLLTLINSIKLGQALK